MCALLLCYYNTQVARGSERERERETPLGIKRLHRSGWLSSLSGMEWAGANKCIFDESSCTRKRGTSYSRWVPPGALMPPIICNRQRKPGRRIIPLTWGPFPEPGILPEQDRLKAEPYPLRLVPVAPSRSLSKYLKAEPESLLCVFGSELHAPLLLVSSAALKLVLRKAECA